MGKSRRHGFEAREAEIAAFGPDGEDSSGDEAKGLGGESGLESGPDVGEIEEEAFGEAVGGDLADAG